MYKNPVLMYRNQGLAYILECKKREIEIKNVKGKKEIRNINSSH
jgi:hypothetical protein